MDIYHMKKQSESNNEACKYKTLGFTGLFSLHIERPSYNWMAKKLHHIEIAQSIRLAISY